MKIISAIVTGSRKYGRPGKKSDIDLVVLVSEEDAALLRRTGDPLGFDDTQDDGTNPYSVWSDCLYFAELNLIVCTKEEDFLIWKKGTEELSKKAKTKKRPIYRDEAVSHFRELRKNREKE